MLANERKHLSPRLYLPKRLLSTYLASACCSAKHLPSLADLPASLVLPKVRLDMAAIATEVDSKTATVAINTDDDVWSMDSEFSANATCAQTQRVECFSLPCMRYFMFPLYGILEKAVQTELSIPVRSLNHNEVKEERQTHDGRKAGAAHKRMIFIYYNFR